MAKLGTTAVKKRKAAFKAVPVVSSVQEVYPLATLNITLNGVVLPRYGQSTATAPKTPFLQMPAFKELGPNRESTSIRTSGDAFLEHLIDDQGWSDPKLRSVVTSAELENHIKNGAIELFRTVKADRGKTAEQLLDEIRYGDIYAGYGIYGNGTYAATDFLHSKTSYGGYGKSQTIRLALKQGIRIIKWRELLKIAKDNAAYHASLKVPRINGKSPFRPLAHLSNLAVWLGFDVIWQEGGNSGVSRASGGHDYYNILNPTAIWIENINMGQPKTGNIDSSVTRVRRKRKVP